jgi:hypothetical protein
MEFAFDPGAPNIVVPVFVTGPRRTWELKLALDTGATRTIIRPHVLASLGIVPPANARRGRIRSATGGAAAPFVAVPHLLALGQVRANFDVLAHDLPPTVTHDGLLGLDFFRGLVLKLDFARGRASLKPPRRWWQFWR